MQQFAGIKNIASNLSNGDKGNYTLQNFKDDYPQFTHRVETQGQPPVITMLAPESIVNMFIDMANENISPNKWKTMWRYGVGLYVAHRVSMYLMTYAPQNDTAKAVVSKARAKGNIASSALGDASISYDNASTSEADAKWGELNKTTYGQQFMAQAKIVGMGGSYVI